MTKETEWLNIFLAFCGETQKKLHLPQEGRQGWWDQKNCPPSAFLPQAETVSRNHINIISPTLYRAEWTCCEALLTMLFHSPLASSSWPLMVKWKQSWVKNVMSILPLCLEAQNKQPQRSSVRYRVHTTQQPQGQRNQALSFRVNPARLIRWVTGRRGGSANFRNGCRTTAKSLRKKWWECSSSSSLFWEKIKHSIHTKSLQWECSMGVRSKCHLLILINHCDLHSYRKFEMIVFYLRFVEDNHKDHKVIIKR